jgi:uncharacterized OB-fold protein
MMLEAALQAKPTGERERVDRAAGRLVGSRCLNCGTHSWPARAVCHRCGEARAEVATLADRGTLVTHTTVWVPRPPLEPPFTLGQVELPEAVLVFAHIHGLEDTDKVPLEVELRLAADAEDVPPFWFVPVRG